MLKFIWSYYSLPTQEDFAGLIDDISTFLAKTQWEYSGCTNKAVLISHEYNLAKAVCWLHFNPALCDAPEFIKHKFELCELALNSLCMQIDHLNEIANLLESWERKEDGNIAYEKFYDKCRFLCGMLTRLINSIRSIAKSSDSEDSDDKSTKIKSLSFIYYDWAKCQIEINSILSLISRPRNEQEIAVRQSNQPMRLLIESPGPQLN